jgi:hypothetical protein
MMGLRRKLLELKNEFISKKEFLAQAGCQWLTPMILATQEDRGSKVPK